MREHSSNCMSSRLRIDAMDIETDCIDIVQQREAERESQSRNNYQKR